MFCTYCSDSMPYALSKTHFFAQTICLLEAHDTQMDVDETDQPAAATPVKVDKAFIPYAVRIRDFFARHPGACIQAGNHICMVFFAACDKITCM